jgi:SMI1 / KNR4 family (SUKH-1)
MTIQEFKKIQSLKGKNLSVFDSKEVQEFTIIDKKATNEDVELFKSKFKFVLPQNYIDFCMTFGGGEFGYITIFSLDNDGDFYLGKFISNELLSEGLIPFSDDGSGGYYCFKLNDDGVVTENIFNIYLGDGTKEKIKVDSFFDFILKYAYNDFQ